MFIIKMKKNKKSQAEIIGLAIIVILITMGLLFFVKFGISNKKDDTKGSFVNSELASNMVTVLLKTTTDCKKSSVSDLFQDYATFNNINCDGMNSDEKLNETMDIIFGETLEKWEKSYKFRAYSSSGQIRGRSYGNKCNGYSNRKSTTYPIPTDWGTLFITLDICS